MKVLVIGASGFVGGYLVNALKAVKGISVSAATRHKAQFDSAVNFVQLPEDFRQMNVEKEQELFAQVDVVILLAAATPTLLAGKSPAASVKALDTNIQMPFFFAQAAKRYAVPQFIFLSSCGVHGAVSEGDAFTELSPYRPHDAYTRSKVEAELLLLQNATLIPPLTIVRPPSVYGAGFRGPMRQLMRLVEKAWPLPFGALSHNKRQFVGVRNLCDFLVRCAGNKKAMGEIFLVADSEPQSTCELLRLIAQANGNVLHLFAVSPAILSFVGYILGLKSPINRLMGSYEINISKAKSQLHWAPPFTTREELNEVYRLEKARAS